MIFSRLFKTKNKWQAKDSNDRIAAINEELSITKLEEREVLLTLLRTDNHELVRRAALLKLHDFDTYVTTSSDNDNERVKQFAHAQVSTILANKHGICLTTEQKQHFLQQKSSEHFLTLWLEQEQEPALIVNLFSQVSQNRNVAHLFSQLFAKKQNTDIQSQLLDLSLVELGDINFLTKLLKKSASKTVSLLIEEKLSQLLAVQEKPKKVQKQYQLLLSKLLALKDLIDYGVYQTKRTQLEQAWQQDLTLLTCLTDEQQQTLKQKHQKITEQLTQLFEPKAEAYQQAVIAKQLLVDQQIAQDAFKATIASINQVITTAALSEAIDEQCLDEQCFDEQKITAQLSTLEQDIKNSVLNTSEQANLIKQVLTLTKRLTQLPEIAQSVSDATDLMVKISQLSLPQSLAELNEGEGTYNAWLVKWKAVESKSFGVLPSSIKSGHQEITTRWQQKLKPLQVEQKQLFNQAKKKLIDIKRLLINGKFKVCFGLFKGVKQTLPLLSPSQQQQLQRDYDHVNEKMTEISDWEHYIATPRKHQLLEEITVLVQSPLDNLNDQADKVKQFRKTWNSLGHADETVNNALNEQFNQACEQAFAPCRLFYSNQEKSRVQHLLDRNNIINQANFISEEFLANQAVEQTVNQTSKEKSVGFKALDGQLNKLQQSWNQAGEVDRTEYSQLQKKFKQALEPIKTAIKVFHADNSQKKQALILQAQEQLTVDDVFQAIEHIKQLQQQWRDIGFAGSRQENKLWQTFRQVNDEIFAKRTHLKTAQHDTQMKLTEQFSQRLVDIKARLNTENTEILGTESEKTMLNQAQQEAQALLSAVVANKPVIKKVANDIEAFLKNLQGLLTAQLAQEQRVSW
ncbi:MAG: DUF349 domain-containing protein, partial [Colwellia sp.]|nr:DUF349 domain-containing protein [Colwellia sp.]